MSIITQCILDRINYLANVVGNDGENGITPHIGDNGNWFIGNTDTGVPAKGQDGLDGIDGHTPYIGSNGNWWIRGYDTVVPATGPKGDKGDAFTYDDFTPEQLEGLEGDDGVPVELVSLEGWIKWRYVGDTDWINLLEISSLRGDHPILMEHDGWVKWKLSEAPDSTWEDLFEVPKDGRTPELMSDGEWINWKYTDDVNWIRLISVSSLSGEDGQDGTDGKNIELGVQYMADEKWVVWRYVGDTDWVYLISIEEFRGNDGITPHIGDNGNWFIGTVDTGIPATGPRGEEGRTQIFRTFEGWVQTKFLDEPITAWTNFYPIPEDGEDGSTPYIGSNGNWWVDGDDTGNPSRGQDGVDGQDGRDGRDGQDGVDGQDGRDGINGRDGETPFIGQDGNWIIGNINTGVPARGGDGNDGLPPNHEINDNNCVRFEMPNGEWGEWICIENNIDLEQIKRTPIRNYVKQTDYSPILTEQEEVTCPPGYILNFDTNKCEKTVTDESAYSCPAGYEKEWDEENSKWVCVKYGQVQVEQEIDIVIVRDWSGSVNGVGRPDQQTGLEGALYDGVLVDEIQAMTDFIDSFIDRFQAQLQSGQVRIALVDFGVQVYLKGMSGTTQVVERFIQNTPSNTEFFLTDINDLKGLNAYKDHFIGAYENTQIRSAFDRVETYLLPLKRENAKMHIVSVVDGVHDSYSLKPRYFEGNPFYPDKKINTNPRVGYFENNEFYSYKDELTNELSGQYSNTSLEDLVSIPLSEDKQLRLTVIKQTIVDRTNPGGGT